MEKEDEQNSGRKQPQGERRFNQQQYDLLKSCSDKKDMTEWNKWRQEHPDKEIRLQGADLSKAHLENAWLWKARLEKASLRDAHLENAHLTIAHMENAYLTGAHLENADLIKAYLENAKLSEAHLENANLRGANLEKAYLGDAHLENACLGGAHLENAILREANLENADLREANLENAKLTRANLENADLQRAHLENAILFNANLKNARLGGAHLANADFSSAYLENTIFWNANLGGASFWDAKLQGADFSRAIVDGRTLLYEDCKVDRKTKFEAVALGNLRIYPNIKQLLEYNIRRKNWKEWYKGKSKNKWIIKMHELLTLPVHLFWCVSNYGLSTWRIIFTFFTLAFVFAVAYWQWPNFVAFNGNPGMENFQDLWHAFYFSVVTMTTLGFGDIAANPDSWKGQGFLMLQVILGYILLGAMVTRFAVLFSAGGPAGKFAPIEEKETEEDKKKKV